MAAVSAAAAGGAIAGGAQQQLTKSVAAQRVSPEYSANCCSKIFFFWPSSLFKTANSSTGIAISDLYRVAGEDDVHVLSARFDAALKKAVADGAQQPVKAAAVALFRKPMLWALFVKCVSHSATNGLLPAYGQTACKTLLFLMMNYVVSRHFTVCCHRCCF